MNSTQPSSQPKVTKLDDFKVEKIMYRARDLMQSLSASDLEVLQNDLYSRDSSYRPVPAILAEHFSEWLSEYGIEAETMMAEENRTETQCRFYEELAAQSDDLQLKAMAEHLLKGKSLSAVN